ncbi:Uncharacterized protein TCM_022873 [Theobroma cacao]|uniref:Integrase catalytic domain-containing protein n=1 Tax=Theobroma cacao TaxID=3641 RepID=A0A061EUE0_THECC|nr:Uncharacterized protein TCM_022873 [Theobroma cacao]
MLHTKVKASIPDVTCQDQSFSTRCYTPKPKLQHRMLHAKTKALASNITRQSFLLPTDVTRQGFAKHYCLKQDPRAWFLNGLNESFFALRPQIISMEPFPKNTTFSFELVHVDLWGPYIVPTIKGQRYFLTLVDDCSRFTWIFLLRNKLDVSYCSRFTWIFLLRNKLDVSCILPSFYQYAKNQFSTSIKCIDHGGEFNLTGFYEKYGIIHQLSCVEASQQNGVVERKHQHVLVVARALVFQTSLPLSFWGEAILTATHILNRIPTKGLLDKSPYKLLYSKIPSYEYLRVFGSLCFVSSLTQNRKKFDKRAIKCVFLRYPNGIKRYKVLDISAKKFIISRNVFFHLSHYKFTDFAHTSSNSTTKNSRKSVAVQNDLPIQNALLFLHLGRTFTTSLSQIYEPITYKQAINYSHWKEAMQSNKEFIALLVYVDNIVIASNTTQAVDRVKKYLSSQFKLRDLRAVKYFLGLEITRSSKGILICQRKYTLDLLEKYGMLGTKLVTTLIDYSHKLSKYSDSKEIVDLTGYRQLVGKLLYLTFTRLDISYAAQVLSHFMEKTKHDHLSTTYRVLKYLKAASSQGILMKSDSNLVVSTYSNSGWVGCIDIRRPVIGYCVFAGDL